MQRLGNDAGAYSIWRRFPFHALTSSARGCTGASALPWPSATSN